RSGRLCASAPAQHHSASMDDCAMPGLIEHGFKAGAAGRGPAVRGSARPSQREFWHTRPRGGESSSFVRDPAEGEQQETVPPVRGPCPARLQLYCRSPTQRLPRSDLVLSFGRTSISASSMKAAPSYINAKDAI